MNTNQTNSPPRIVYFQPGELRVDPQAGLQQGYLGVATAFLIGGIECLIVTRGYPELGVIHDCLNRGGKPFDFELTYPVAVITQDVVSIPSDENDRASGTELPRDEGSFDEETFDVQVHPKTAVPVDDDEEL